MSTTYPENVNVRSRLLVLLGARMARTRGPGRWHFPLFLEGDNASGLRAGEVSGGGSRMRAVQTEYVRFRDAGKGASFTVLVTGGRERDGSSRSDEETRQLVERYGLPSQAVVSIRGEGSTLGNAAATVRYMCSPNAVSRGNTIEVVTNDYHMLRAWIIFSRGMLLATTGARLVVHSDVLECIRHTLTEGLPTNETWSQDRVRTDRESVIALLRPCFSKAKIEVVPLVVEEALERASYKREATQRYASLLRNNRWVKETLRHEYMRVMELFDGKPERAGGKA
jgi:hypothetical protein